MVAAPWLLAPLTANSQPRPDEQHAREKSRVVLLELEEGRRAIALTGLSKPQQQAVADADWSNDKWRKLLAVYVGEKARQNDTPPLLGSYRRDGDRILFEPRFPLRDGLAYTIEYDLGVLGANADGSRRPVTLKIETPSAPAAPPARLEQVFPTRDVLPENQLKFYFHFSAPMSRGDVYRYIRLFKQEGEEVEMPFLELEQELWDENGTRFTLFFDPGRIKRGLKPREEVGPALEEGKSYTLVVSRNWADANGRPLAGEFRKSFRVVAPDDVQPKLSNWKLSSPAAGGRQPLAVAFDEPLDHAMLHRVIGVRGSGGKPIAGRVQVDREETRWRFTPDQPWTAGQHDLVVHTTLEDLAGNSLGRPFEVDIFDKVDRSIQSETVTLPFTVSNED